MSYLAVRWAVFLGCDTATRLSEEWRIGPILAENLLLGAVEEQLIEPTVDGRFRVRIS